MKCKKLLAAAATAAVCSAAFFCGCSSDYETQRATCYYMGTEAYLVLTADFTDEEVESRANAMLSATKSTLSAIEQSISTSVSGSYISLFNAAEAGESIKVDEICYSVLSLAKEVYELTGGYYNPGVYYSVDLYGFAKSADTTEKPYDRDDYSILPDEEYITAFQTLSQCFGDIVLTCENGSYFVTKPQATVEVEGVTYSLKIDLGGIGKGYAADIIDALFEEYGFAYGYFSFGSSSVAVKGSYENKDGAWNVGLRDPRGSVNDTYLSVSVADECLSSSGDYEQYYEVDGTRYCHIINPMTGSPVQTGIITATVIGGTAAEDDALTTALMAMGLTNAVNFINENLTDRKVAFVYESGENYYIITNDPEAFTITGSGYASGNTVDERGKIVLNNDVA